MNLGLPRRDFLKSVAVLAAASTLGVRQPKAAERRIMPEPSPSKLPRWRGFNLLEKFIAKRTNAPFRESDFELMADWGFNFVRLPMSYLCWSSSANWRHIDENVLKDIDQAVEFGRQYGIHVCLNFHRAPGYSVDTSVAEPFNLWNDPEALEACSYHWAHFAARYRGIPSARVSFDLFNEPATLMTKPMTLLGDAQYARVARSVVNAIRTEDPQRLVISDGLMWGTVPVPELADLGVAQSTRGYAPTEVSHYKAEWVKGADKMTEPTWPLTLTPEQVRQSKAHIEGLRQTFHDNPIIMQSTERLDSAMPWGRERFKQQQIEPWKLLEAMGVGVHVGECGVYSKTPHRVALAYLRDVTDLWREADWGWAVWNLRGSFGPLDSGRADVRYERFKGHQLDREMLELLRNA